MASSFFSLEGHTALVTGGTRGIGAAVAIGFAEAGADVLLVQRDESNTATRDAILKLGRKAQIYTADLSSQESVAALVPKVLKDGHQIRILVNCAGIQKRHPCEKFPDDDFNAVSHSHIVPSRYSAIKLNSGILTKPSAHTLGHPSKPQLRLHPHPRRRRPHAHP